MLDDDARYQCQVGPGPQGKHFIFIESHKQCVSLFFFSSSPADFTDQNKYISGQPGIRSRFATLTILVPPEPPRILQGDFLVTTEDREIELECVSVGGKPAAEVI